MLFIYIYGVIPDSYDMTVGGGCPQLRGEGSNTWRDGSGEFMCVRDSLLLDEDKSSSTYVCMLNLLWVGYYLSEVCKWKPLAVGITEQIKRHCVIITHLGR